MSSGGKTLCIFDPSKYPTRFGQPWKDDEVIKLLSSIQKKKSIEDIATEHERTVSSIQSYIRKLAVDYYNNDKRPIEEIQKFTGLTKEQIADAIQKHEIRKYISEQKASTKSKVVKKTKTEEKADTTVEIVSLLKDIQEKLNILVERLPT